MKIPDTQTFMSNRILKAILSEYQLPSFCEPDVNYLPSTRNIISISDMIHLLMEFTLLSIFNL